jgi:hypothetical protein|tara:strand:- start:410 stop:520 length:111 start_codon:yes stop_codon:yes gene_type:complete
MEIKARKKITASLPYISAISGLPARASIFQNAIFDF